MQVQDLSGAAGDEAARAHFVQSLASAAASVAYADGRLHPAERRELGACARRCLSRGTMRRWNVLALFDDRMGRLQRDPCRHHELLHDLTLLAGTPRASLVLRTAERIAAADGGIDEAEMATLCAIRACLGIESGGRPRFAACLLWGFPSRCSSSRPAAPAYPLPS
jgi:tellurite resistance protein